MARPLPPPLLMARPLKEEIFLRLSLFILIYQFLSFLLFVHNFLYVSWISSLPIFFNDRMWCWKKTLRIFLLMQKETEFNSWTFVWTLVSVESVCLVENLILNLLKLNFQKIIKFWLHIKIQHLLLLSPTATYSYNEDMYVCIVHVRIQF